MPKTVAPLPHDIPAAAPVAPTGPDDAVVDERTLARLRWRCRRGMLENDLLIERFFSKYGQQLNVRQAAALAELMEIDDNDLLDLLLARKPLSALDPALQDRADLNEILTMLKGKSHETR